MANVGPIGSTIFTNQMMPAVSTTQTAENNRVDFQNMAAQAAVNEKQKEVEDVRPAEENHSVDPDREHQKEEGEENAKMTKKREKKEQDDDADTLENMGNALHKLDIKV